MLRAITLVCCISFMFGCSSGPTKEERAATAAKRAAAIQQQNRLIEEAGRKNKIIQDKLAALEIGKSSLLDIPVFITEFARAKSAADVPHRIFINGMIRNFSTGKCRLNYQIGGARLSGSGNCDGSGHVAYSFSQKRDRWCPIRQASRRQAARMARKAFTLSNAEVGMGELLVGKRCGGEMVARVRFNLKTNVITRIDRYNPPIKITATPFRNVR